jgi:LysM repeat protein
MSAFMNQIILAHSSVIGEECIVRCEDETKNQKKKNITFDEKHWKNWKVIIRRFTLIASNKVFWEIVKNKAEKIDDPRLSSSKVDEIRNSFLQDIVEPNFTFMSDALISKDYERVKQHSSLLKEDWIPNESSLPSEVLRKGFNRILASQTDLLNRYAQNAAKELKKVEKGEKDADKVVIDIYSKLIDNVTDIIYEGSLVDPNSISDFAIAKNEIAKVMRDCASKLNNNLNSNTDLSIKEKKSERFQAYEMIRKAIEYASTTYTKQKYEKEDEEAIKYNLEMAGGSPEFADTADTKQKHEKDEEVIKKNLEKAGKSSGINWVSTLSYLCWGAIILFFIIIPNVYHNSSSSKPPTSTPSSTWTWHPPTSTSSTIPAVIQNRLSEEETSGKIYVVEVGDSLGKIAQKFGTTTEKIIARNELANPNLIRPGQKLIIPTE